MFYSSGFGIPVMSLITCAAARFEPVPLLFDVLSSDYFMYDNQNNILVYSLSMYALRRVYYNTNISSINKYIDIFILYIYNNPKFILIFKTAFTVFYTEM